jgi:hypothetical protein
MAGLVEMFGRVLSLGRVATPDVPAGQAHAQVNPAAAGAQAFLASIGVRRDGADLGQVRAAGGHARTCGWDDGKGRGIFMAWAPWRSPAANRSIYMDA